MAIRVCGIAVTYAANVLLSRLLGASDYGKYAIALSWALILALPAKAGFDLSSVRYAPVYLERAEHSELRGFITFAAAGVFAVSLIMGVGIVLAGQRFKAADPHMALWAALMVMPLALLTVFSVLMRVAQRVIASQFYEQVLRPSLVIVGALAIVLTGAKLTAAKALALTTLAAFGALVMLLLHFRTVFAAVGRAQPRFGPWREWLAVGVPMLLMGVVQEVMNHVEVVLLGVLATAREAGLFAASWRIASLVPFVFVGLSVMAAPLTASAYERRAFDELNRISALVARVGFAFALVVTLALLATGKWLLWLFGSEFVAAYPVLIVLLAGGVVNAFTGIVGYLMILTGRERQALVVFAGALGLSILLNLVLIPRLGAVGAAISSSSATAAWNLVMLLYVRRSMGIDASALALRPRQGATVAP